MAGAEAENLAAPRAGVMSNTLEIVLLNRQGLDLNGEGVAPRRLGKGAGTIALLVNNGGPT